MGVRPARPLITQNTRFDPWKDPLGLIAAYRLARKRRRVFSWLWRGPWPWTTVVVSGHRTTYGAPFFKLNQLEPGDEIHVLLPFAALVYKVTRTMIVLPTETVVAQRGIEELSLTTCEPIYSARRRLIVQAELSVKCLDCSKVSTQGTDDLAPGSASDSG